MNLFEIILLAIALGIDCFIVSFAQGLVYQNDRFKTALKLAITMGLFQGLMPLAGNIATDYAKVLFEPYGKWVVITVFMALGLQFMLDSFHPKDYKNKLECISIKCLIALGIATSVDALLSGITLNLTYTHLGLACTVIGLASLIMSLTGFRFTNSLRTVPANRLQFLGGLILVFLGVKNFFF